MLCCQVTHYLCFTRPLLFSMVSINCLNTRILKYYKSCKKIIVGLPFDSYGVKRSWLAYMGKPIIKTTK